MGPLDPRLLFPAGDTEALGGAALWARLSASELEAVGQRGRRLVFEHHNPAAWEERLRSIYRSIVECQRSDSTLYGGVGEVNIGREEGKVMESEVR